MESKKNTYRIKKSYVIIALFVLSVIVIFFKFYGLKKSDTGKDQAKEVTLSNTDIVDGIHVGTGLKEGEGLMIVIGHCTACHSADLIIQNRMTKEQWNATIRWMQETQNLWDLGEHQEVIVNYLVKNYPIVDKGRRAKLENIEWYELKE